MNIFDEFPKLMRALDAGSIRYALIGGIAMAFHDEPRFTRDIDILIIPDDLARLQAILEREGFIPSAPPWSFKNAGMTLHRFIKISGTDHVLLDVMTADDSDHIRIIERALDGESGHGTARVATKEDLIWLKRRRNSDQDQVDVKKLHGEGQSHETL